MGLFSFFFEKINNYVKSDGVGVVGVYNKFRQSIESNLGQRIDKTDEFFVELDRNFVYEEKLLKIPKKAKSFQKPFSQVGRLFINIDGKKYTLERIKDIAGQDNVNGKKLYEIKGFKKGIKEYDKNKITKINAVWIDAAGNISDANKEDSFVTYKFKGKIKSFSIVDRDKRTGDVSFFKSLFTAPIGIASYSVKYLTYKASNFVFNFLPKLLDRIISPVVCFAVFLPAFIVVKPFSLLFSEQKKESVSNFFKKILDFNKSVFVSGLSNVIIKDVLDIDSLNKNIEAIENGNFSPKNKSEIYAKKNLASILKTPSLVLDILNIAVSNFANIISCYLKGSCNAFLYIIDGDKGYIESAKFLFKEPR